jgi:hypothetical protein
MQTNNEMFEKKFDIWGGTPYTFRSSVSVGYIRSIEILYSIEND